MNTKWIANHWPSCFKVLPIHLSGLLKVLLTTYVSFGSLSATSKGIVTHQKDIQVNNKQKIA